MRGNTSEADFPGPLDFCSQLICALRHQSFRTHRPCKTLHQVQVAGDKGHIPIRILRRTKGKCMSQTSAQNLVVIDIDQLSIIADSFITVAANPKLSKNTVLNIFAGAVLGKGQNWGSLKASTFPLYAPGVSAAPLAAATHAPAAAPTPRSQPARPAHPARRFFKTPLGLGIFMDREDEPFPVHAFIEDADVPQLCDALLGEVPEWNFALSGILFHVMRSAGRSIVKAEYNAGRRGQSTAIFDIEDFRNFMIAPPQIFETAMDALWHVGNAPADINKQPPFAFDALGLWLNMTDSSGRKHRQRIIPLDQLPALSAALKTAQPGAHYRTQDVAFNVTQGSLGRCVTAIYNSSGETLFTVSRPLDELNAFFADQYGNMMEMLTASDLGDKLQMAFLAVCDSGQCDEIIASLKDEDPRFEQILDEESTDATGARINKAAADAVWLYMIHVSKTPKLATLAMMSSAYDLVDNILDHEWVLLAGALREGLEAEIAKSA